MKDLLLPNTVNQKDAKPDTAGPDDTAIPKYRLKRKLNNRNTVNPHVPLFNVSYHLYFTNTLIYWLFSTD